jgi:hypothetical protein
VQQINLCQDSVFSVCYECSVPLARVECYGVIVDVYSVYREKSQARKGRM